MPKEVKAKWDTIIKPQINKKKRRLHFLNFPWYIKEQDKSSDIKQQPPFGDR